MEINSHPCLEDGTVGFVFKLLSGTQEVEALVSRPDNLGSYDYGSYGGRENQLTNCPLASTNT